MNRNILADYRVTLMFCTRVLEVCHWYYHSDCKPGWATSMTIEEALRLMGIPDINMKSGDEETSVNDYAEWAINTAQVALGTLEGHFPQHLVAGIEVAGHILADERSASSDCAKALTSVLNLMELL